MVRARGRAVCATRVPHPTSSTKFIMSDTLELERPMAQTPAYDTVNTGVLKLLPAGLRRVVDVGCMRGALARTYRATNPDTHWTGIDIDPAYAEAAQANCQLAFAADIESMPPAQWASLFPSDAWVFGDSLEHLRNPWRVLASVRRSIDRDGCAVVSLPNAQHWSVQWRLATGAFRYEDQGLLDRTHLRWFTRITALEMFRDCGWAVEEALAMRLPDRDPPPAVLSAIVAIAAAGNVDAATATADAQAFQYMFRLRPTS